MTTLGSGHYDYLKVFIMINCNCGFISEVVEEAVIEYSITNLN